VTAGLPSYARVSSKFVGDELWERVHAIKQRYSSRLGGSYYCSVHREKSACDADRGIGAHELEERVLNGLGDHEVDQLAYRKRRRSQS
jgi:hypothetical protein